MSTPGPWVRVQWEEMLEALERAETHLAAMADITTEQYGPETLSPRYAESLDMVRAVIAKAKGEQPPAAAYRTEYFQVCMMAPGETEFGDEDIVIWFKAPSKEVVEAFCNKQSWAQQRQEATEMDNMFKDCRDNEELLGSGIDVILDAEGKVAAGKLSDKWLKGGTP